MARTHFSLLILLVTALLTTAQGCFFYFLDEPRSHATRAEDLARQGKLQEAIDEYRLHMEKRRAHPRRPAEENPSFYRLFIGDLYLEMGDVEQAIAEYEGALSENVEQALVAERLRRLGQWYAGQDRYEKGIEVLRKYRDLDHLTFDLEIDRLHKESIRVEDLRDDANEEDDQDAGR